MSSLVLCHLYDSLVFTEIDATEYLDDLWGRNGQHITKFEVVIVNFVVGQYMLLYAFACEGIMQMYSIIHNMFITSIVVFKVLKHVHVAML